MLVVWSFVIFFAALFGIGFFTIQAVRFLGGALNKNRPQRSRAVAGLISALSFLAVIGSGAGGFVGISAVWYAEQIKAAAKAPPR